jgi:hypothetical protein
MHWNQVKDDLLPHVAIDVHRLGQWRAIHDEPQPGPFAGGLEVTGQFRGELRQVGRLVHRLQAAGFDPREVQQRVDELHQTQAAAVRHLQALALPVGERFAGIRQSVLDRSEHQRQGRAELV